MHRRELLGLLGAGASALAGCGSADSERVPPTPNAGGSDAAPTPSNTVYPFEAGAASEFEYEESDTGTVIIHVPVENTRDEAYGGTLSLTVQVGDEQRTVSRPVQLAGGERKTFALRVDANWSEWTPNFQDVSFSEGIPLETADDDADGE